MDELAREHLISFYNTSLTLFGDRPEAVRWTPKGQLCHYLSLLDIAGSIQGKKVLDFGCGKGDFLTFLRERNIEVQYTGVDINENLIALAREKNPDATFRVFDLEKETFDEDFDYIFLCGVFNLRVHSIEEIIRKTLKRLFHYCRRGMAFNSLSSHNPKKDFALHYVSPEEVFVFAVENLSPVVSLRHDRISYDFTLFVYRDANPFS
jgi:SAM-dependent methyltransferase